MTTNCSPSGASPAGRADRSRDEPRRIDDPQDAGRRDEFERVLRHKRGVHDDDDTPQQHEEPGREPSVLDAAAVAAPLAALARARTASIEGVAASSLVAMEAVSAAQQQALAATPPAADAGCAFEVSLNEPLGVALSLRATRDAAAAHEPARWTLAIASPALSTAALRRHAPRLDERLRTRALADEPVRVEGNEEAKR